MINVKKGVQGFIKGLPSFNKGRKLSKEHLAKIKKAREKYLARINDAFAIAERYNTIKKDKPMEIKIGEIQYERKRENRPYLMIGLIIGVLIGLALTVAGFYIARYNAPWPIYTILLNKTIYDNYTIATATVYSNGICKGTFISYHFLSENSLNLTPIKYDCYNISSKGPLLLRKNFIKDR